MIRERCKRAILALLDVDDPNADRDWAAMEHEVDLLAENARDADRTAAMWKQRAENAEAALKRSYETRDANEAAWHRLKSEHEATEKGHRVALEALRLEREEAREAHRVTRAELEEARKAVKVEHASAVGGLVAIVDECDKRLPPKHQLCEDDRDPVRLVLRSIRNLATRGLQNDPVLTREAKEARDAEVKRAQEVRAALAFAVHYRQAMAEIRKTIANAFEAADLVGTTGPGSMVERAKKFGIEPMDGEAIEDFRRRVFTYFPPKGM